MMIPEIARYRCVTGGAESGRRPSVLWLAGLTRLALWLLAGNFLVTCLLAQTPQPPVNVSVSPSSGSGMGPQTFAFTSSSVNGYAYINWMGMPINYSIAEGACSFNYAPQSNVIWIVGDDGASYVGTGNLGVAGTIENSQCRLDVGASSVVKSGNNVTVNLALTFKPGLPGPQNIYLYTGDNGNLAANWQQMGTWTTSTVSSVGPALVSAAPNSGTGLAQKFSYVASSPNGYSYITQMYVLFETTLGSTPACSMYYNLVGNYVVLIDDAGGWSMSHHLATPGTLHNSQCTLDYGASSATGSGNSLTLNLALTFNAAWTGTKNNYLYVGDRGNHAAGWTQMGAWTVGASAQPPVNVSVSPPSGSGLGPQTFAFTSSSVNGSGYINWMGMLLNYGIAPGACSFNYAPLSNVIWIVGDDGASYVESGNLGVAGTIENSQCRLDVGASSIVKTYNSVTVNLALTFKAGLPGPQNTYLYTGDSGGLAANWQQMGTWTTSTVSSTGPALVSATPSTGTGLAQTFNYVASSRNGYSYITQMYVLFETSLGATPACSMYYNLVGNYVVLIDDAGGWGMSQHLGTPGTLHNSQCTLDYGASSATGSGNNLTLTLALTFNSSWGGVKNNYLYVLDRGNHAAGWTQMGAWTVPADFTISTATGMATVLAGGATSYTVSVTGTAGFSGPVVFDAPGLPAGVTASFNPASISGSGQTTMTVIASSALGGYYVITATGTSGSLVHTAGINLAVQKFTATPTAATLTAGPNSTVQYVFAITSFGGFNAAIDVVPASVQIQPAGNPNNVHCTTVSPYFSSQPGAGTVTVKLFLGPCDASYYNIPLLLAGGGMSQPAPVVLAAFSTGTFSLAATPAVQTVAAGTNATFGINVTAANGFNGQVSFFQYTTKPACATYVTFPSPVTGTGGTSLVLGTSQCAPGTYPVNIVGNSNSITNSVSVSLMVQGPAAPATIVSPLPPPAPSGVLASRSCAVGQMNPCRSPQI